MKVIGTVFDPDAVSKAVERREDRLKEGGTSCIVDWQSPKDKFSERLMGIAREVGELFGASFEVHQHLHSTVLSIKLDEKDIEAISESTRQRVRDRPWRDEGYKSSQKMFRSLLEADEQRSGLTLELECAAMDKAGTVQLVLRNEDQLPAMRGYMVSQGAQVKPGTIDGDRIYTCTVVLGQVKDADEAEKCLPTVRSYLSTLTKGEPFSTKVLTFVHYKDFGLVECEEPIAVVIA